MQAYKVILEHFTELCEDTEQMTLLGGGDYCAVCLGALLCWIPFTLIQ